MIQDKKVFAISLIYCFIAPFLIIPLFTPFRVIYDFENFGYYLFYYSYYSYYDLTYYFLIPQTVRLIFSRGVIPFIIGIIFFVISMILFLKFNTGRKNMAFLGFLFCIISSGLLILSAVINFIVYTGRIMDPTALYITLAIGITEINLGILIFTNRKDIEEQVIDYKDYKKLIQKRPDKQKLVEKPIEEKILSDQPKPPSIPEEEKEYCAFCGNEVKRSHNFCRKCGKALNH